jgi:hypothetical protein
MRASLHLPADVAGKKNASDKWNDSTIKLILTNPHYVGDLVQNRSTTAGDFGADVITVKDKTKTVIQAKCFGEGQSVGVKAINEICGGAGYWNGNSSG